jgi:hypothetical protein
MVVPGTSGCAVVTVLDEDVGLQALVVRRAVRELPWECRLGRIGLGVAPAAWERPASTQPPSAELMRRLVGLRVTSLATPEPGSGPAESAMTEVVVSSMVRVSDDEAAVSVTATCGGSKVEETYRFFRILGVWRSVNE